MAQLSYHSFGWVGHGFHPGAEHSWWFGPVNRDEVLHVTPIPTTAMPTEIMVKDERIRNNPGTNEWTFLFTVRNTGPNTIPGYGLRFSVVRP
jgi:hypothetical protein